jgi:hypothetical protein
MVDLVDLAAAADEMLRVLVDLVLLGKEIMVADQAGQLAAAAEVAPGQ